MIEHCLYHTRTGDFAAIVVRKYGDMRDLLVDAPDADGSQPHMVTSVPFWQRTEIAKVQIGVAPGGAAIMADKPTQVEVFNSWKPL